MKKLSCVIVDDEKIARETLLNMIKLNLDNQLEVVGMAGSVSTAAEIIQQRNPEIVFLDIEMSGESGFDLFPHFKHIFFEVIFTTAHMEYAIDAIKTAALDYLLKPISHRELKDALLRYRRKKQMQSSQQRIETLINNLSMGIDFNQKVAFPLMNGYQVEKINNIAYCEGDVNYSRVYMSDGRMVMISRTLKEVQKLLSNNCFFRIHKSYIINLNHVKIYSRSERRVYLDNGRFLPIATRKTDEFLQVLTQWHKR